MVIGHEMTHGFDDRASQYDGKGNLREWQTPDGPQGIHRADRLRGEGVRRVRAGAGAPKLNGKLTLGENTADNGGMRIAYMALMNTLAAGGQEGDDEGKIDRLHAGAAVLHFASGRCGARTATEQSARVRRKTDPHSPGEWRMNGTVQNFDEFGKAFGCKKGQPMYPENSCRVW